MEEKKPTKPSKNHHQQNKKKNITKKPVAPITFLINTENMLTVISENSIQSSGALGYKNLTYSSECWLGHWSESLSLNIGKFGNHQEK